jgi:hypothetical protein
MFHFKITVMANWCINMVVFSGKLRQLIQLEKMVVKMIEKEIRDNKGQMFPMIKTDTGYLFEMEYHGDVLCYLTRWQPNTEVLMAVANWLVLNYVHTYQEPAMGIYGKDTYVNKVLTEAYITPEDHALFSLESEGWYVYKGERFDEINDIYDLIIADRLRESKPSNTD